MRAWHTHTHTHMENIRNHVPVCLHNTLSLSLPLSLYLMPVNRRCIGRIWAIITTQYWMSLQGHGKFIRNVFITPFLYTGFEYERTPFTIRFHHLYTKGSTFLSFPLSFEGCFHHTYMNSTRVSSFLGLRPRFEHQIMHLIKHDFYISHLSYKRGAWLDIKWNASKTPLIACPERYIAMRFPILLLTLIKGIRKISQNTFHVRYLNIPCLAFSNFVKSKLVQS